jgi:hypothetical protein
VSIVGKRENISLLRAQILFARKLSTGVQEGFRNFGTCPTVTLTTEIEEEDVYDWSQASAPLLTTLQKRTVPAFTIELMESDPYNLALVFQGEVSSFTQAATPVTAEAHPAVPQGTLIAVNKLGPITSVSVKGTGGTPTYVLDTDYTIESGKQSFIKTKVGGAITSSTPTELSYTPTAYTALNKILAGLTTQVTGAMKIIGQNPAGPQAVINIWQVQIRPDGDKSFVGENADRFRLHCKVLSDAANNPTDPYWDYTEIAAGV